jgi:hypothetical protein
MVMTTHRIERNYEVTLHNCVSSDTCHRAQCLLTCAYFFLHSPPKPYIHFSFTCNMSHSPPLTPFAILSPGCHLVLMPVAERSKARVFAPSLAGIAGSNPTRGGGVWIYLSLVSVLYCQAEVCVRPITSPEGSYRYTHKHTIW